MPRLERLDEVYVLDLGEDRNVINPELLDGISAALDEVVASPPPRGLVTTHSGEFFRPGSTWNGWMRIPDGVGRLVDGMHELFARMLELPVPTVAALQRHAVAGGALLALAHDFRVIRADRFTTGASDLARARLAPQVAHEAMTTGRRYTGPEAVAAGIVDESVEAGEVVERAVAIAKAHSGKDPETYGAIKSNLYRETLASLRDPAERRADVERFSWAIELMRSSEAGE